MLSELFDKVLLDLDAKKGYLLQDQVVVRKQYMPNVGKTFLDHEANSYGSHSSHWKPFWTPYNCLNGPLHNSKSGNNYLLMVSEHKIPNRIAIGKSVVTALPQLISVFRF